MNKHFSHTKRPFELCIYETEYNENGTVKMRITTRPKININDSLDMIGTKSLFCLAEIEEQKESKGNWENSFMTIGIFTHAVKKESWHEKGQKIQVGESFGIIQHVEIGKINNIEVVYYIDIKYNKSKNLTRYNANEINYIKYVCDEEAVIYNK